MITKQIALDLWKQLKEPITAVQYEADARQLTIYLKSGGLTVNVAGASVVFYAIKPDGTVLYNACTVVDGAAGEVSYVITEQTCAVAGKLRCWIDIFADGKHVRSQEFTITVQPSVDSTSAIESTSEFSELAVSLALIAGFDARLATAEENIAGMITAVKHAMHRIGDIITSISDTNPSEEYGGTWILWGSGRVPVGIDAAQAEFNTVEKTGGEKTHILASNEIPSVNITAGGTQMSWNKSTGGGESRININTTAASYNTNFTGGFDIIVGGGGEAHNNLPPYITCYMWKKTA